ncbi:hypothetical protein HYX70_02895 [Candidatus Saccharibacteria bacterium]|nr:hypothetical protein [Candidatus Saccharibacteria bacterium]
MSVPTTIAWQWFGDQYARGMVDRYRQGVLGVLTDGRPRTASMIRRAFWGTPANEVLGKILWQLESSGYIESEMKNARPATHPEDVVEREFYTITPVGRELLTGHRRKATT